MKRAEREERLREEVRHHIDLATQSNIQRGMTANDARREAMLAFGAVESFKEDARDQFRSRTLAMLAQDCRYAVRAVRHAPMLAAVAIVTLAIAFALATSAFTAVNGVLLRALPYAAPDRLAVIWGTTAVQGEQDPVSFTNASDWRRDVRSFESLALFSPASRPILAGPGDPARVAAMQVSADFFPVLRARPLLGRLFDSTDFNPGDAATVVLTWSIWHNRFSGDPSVVNSSVVIDGAPTTVIGILPPESPEMPAALTPRPDLYRPLMARYDDTERSFTFLRAIGRLKPGASLSQAQAELDLENGRLAGAHPETNQGHGAVVESLSEYLTRPIRPALIFVQIGALLVLLVACANVTNLLLARATVRRREFAVRVALGASQPRLARQIATECLLLGGVSGIVGVLLTFPVMAAISHLAAAVLPDARGIALDWRVIGFAITATFGITIIFAITGIAASRGDRNVLAATLRDGGRSGTAQRSVLRRALVVVQLALAMIILVGAGLLARSYRQLRDVQPGFNPSGVLTARVMLPDATYPRGAKQVAFFQQVIDRISHLPGVDAAGAVSILPESGNYNHTNVKVVGRAYLPGDEPTPDVSRVTPGYFDALRIPLHAGRFFTATDDDQHPLVALVNQTMARTLFPGEEAVGRRIWTGSGNAERTIVGVVNDVYQYGLDGARTMQLYVPHADNSGGDLTLVVHGTTSAAALMPGVRAAVRATDPGVPLDDLLTMDQVLATSATRRRLLADLSLIFACGAISLAAIGLYGVMAYSVAQRTKEIGVRMALGATARAIVLEVVGDASRLVVVGLTTGLLVAAALARLMAPLLFGVQATDMVTFIVAAAALLAVGIIASAIPAARSASVSPLLALRDE